MAEFHNFSCDRNYNQLPIVDDISSLEYTLKLLLIMLVTFLIIVFNLSTILILHNKHYSCHLRELPKNLMTWLSLTDLSMGVFVTPLCFVSLAKGCFPFDKLVCEIQSLLISSLFHASSLLLISIAIDRYICINYPLRYRSIMTKKVHNMMAVFSLLYSFVVYIVLIVPNSEFTFDRTGLFNCEPFYLKNRNIIIIAFMLFFIPSILVIVYCYSAIFLVAQRQIRRDSINGFFIKFENNKMIKEKKKLYSSLIILGSISVGFLISISPWTLIEFVTSVWKIKFSNNIQFIVTWIAISNSFWNPILYGLLNKHFRTSCQDFVCRCHWLPNYRATDASAHNTTATNHNHHKRSSAM